MIANNGASVKCEQLQEQLQELVGQVEVTAAAGRGLYQLEASLLNGLLNIGRGLVNMYIGLQGDGDLGPTVATPDGRTLHRSEEPKNRPLRTIFGQHEFSQFVYCAGKGKAIELRPLDARMELPEGVCSYLLEEFSQMFNVEQAFRQTRDSIRTVFGQTLSVDTLEHVNRRMAEQAESFFDSRAVPAPAEEGELMVISADCKGVPMVVADSRNVLPFEDPLQRPGNRKMAALGSVYSVDRFVRTPEQLVAALFRETLDDPLGRRPIPCGKQIRAEFTSYDPEAELVIPGPYPIMNWLCEQARQRDPDGTRPLIRLLDGQTSLRDAGDAFLDGAQFDRLIDILDILHVSGYVWKAALVFHTSGSAAARSFVRDRILRILKGEAAGVIRGLRRMGTEHGLTGEKKKSLRRICRYLENNLDRMKYDEYLAAGYPIATGVIEGACRHLVKDRLERSGMRWTLPGARAMLHLRAIHINQDWKDYQTFRIAAEQKTIHPLRTLLPEYNPALIA